MDITALKATYIETPAMLQADSKVTPLLDAEEYFSELNRAFDFVGKGSNAENQAADEFIFVSGFWLALDGGAFAPGDFLDGPVIGATGASGERTFDPVKLPTPNDRKLRDILEEKARNGVDVRVMGWAHYALVKSIEQGAAVMAILPPFLPVFGPIPISYAVNRKVLPTSRNNAFTVNTIKNLRDGPIGAKAMINVLNHGGGSTHAKMIVVGRKVGTSYQAVAFTGGIDLVSNRWSLTSHVGANAWHDVAAKVEGGASQGIYDTFRDIWNGNVSLRGFVRFNLGGDDIDHRLFATPPISNRTMAALPAGQGSHLAQSLRTFPSNNHAVFIGTMLNLMPRPVPWFWGTNGIFEAANALRKVISAATQYIYIEDQYFWAKDVYQWINVALKDTTRPNLRVIMVTSGGDDPDEESSPAAYRDWHISQHLMNGLTPDQRNRVKMFARWGDVVEVNDLTIDSVIPLQGSTTVDEITIAEGAWADLEEDSLKNANLEIHQNAVKVRVVGNRTASESGTLVLRANKATPALAAGAAKLKKLNGITVHSKTVLIDDHWAWIGSANMASRSLYTDIEHCIAFIDSNDTAVKEYRKRLWSHHFRHQSPNDFESIEASLHAWEPAWFAQGSAPPRPVRADGVGPPYLDPLDLTATPSEPDMLHYRKFVDVDSRDAEWSVP